MFDSNRYDFSPAVSTVTDWAVAQLTAEYEASTVAEANAIAVFRAVRWLAVGFVVLCVGALTLGVSIGLAVVAACQWLAPRLAKHHAAVMAAKQVDIAGWRDALVAFLARRYGEAERALSVWAVKPLA